MADTHETRMQRAMQSLDGLSVGDAFGQCFFSIALDEYAYDTRITNRIHPNHRWLYTDDTEMALGIIEVLQRHAQIDQDDLAETFARRYARDDRRGYGGMAHRILREIGAGEPWRDVSRRVFDGMGSLGNGGAMRVGPLGAYFADDIERAVNQAKLSAEVTHAHPEGQAGAIAVAAAAVFAANHCGEKSPSLIRAFMEFVLEHTPDSQTRAGVAQAIELPRSYDIATATSVLGDGSKISAPDTVPICIWCAARHFDSYPDAMWTTVACGGDRDTNCAIVGGIVALSAREDAVPKEWLDAREQLHL